MGESLVLREDETKVDERREGRTLSLVLVVVTSLISYVAGAMGLVPWINHQVGQLPVQIAQPPAANSGALDSKRLEDVLQAIQRQYVENVDADKLNEGALRGMVQALDDRYSAYFTPSQYKDFVQHFEPSFSGIGVTVELSQKTGLVTVVSPIKGSPGEKAGLRAGDSIVEVDGKDITNMDLNEAVALIKGPKGTQVTILVKREGEAEPLSFTITRDTVTVPSLRYRMLDRADGIGYVQLLEFNKSSAKQVEDAIADLRKQGMTGLILDVRQNPGGLLDEAVALSSIFVPEGQPVVHIVDRAQGKRSHNSRGKKAWDLPLVVLVDEFSASASEILAGAVKDTKVGTVMGVKTFGKGSVQTFWELPDGAGIKLTTAKYLTAGGTSINGVGVEPDIVVENPNKVVPGDPGDPQLEAATQQIKSMRR